VNKEQWEEFQAKPGTGSIDDMMVMVNEINRLRKGLELVREIYTYKDGLNLPVEHIASQMDRRAQEFLEN
jgi:predicted alpha-1,6-mannanase (GH76 family)